MVVPAKEKIENQEEKRQKQFEHRYSPVVHPEYLCAAFLLGMFVGLALLIVIIGR
jgi:hypothetical protein